jgi:pimeloyl-ACP methyl ester carboxylesterase
MSSNTELTKTTIELDVPGVRLKLATMYRAGEGAPILFLHGFGSTKEDYADVVLNQAFDGHPIIAYDAPGCGETECDDLNAVSIPFLVETARRLLAHFSVADFHLVGHSMGGLTALLLADAEPTRVLSFTDIEGNVAPEDCFLSRQIMDFPSESAEAFFENFVERTWHSHYHSSAFYAASLRHKVRAAAVPGIFKSMVELSDHGDLMRRFLSLPCPRMFMHGEENDGLSYLSGLRENGVRVARIRSCGHFPMYSNPVEMWNMISAFISHPDGSH